MHNKYQYKIHTQFIFGVNDLTFPIPAYKFRYCDITRYKVPTTDEVTA